MEAKRRGAEGRRGTQRQSIPRSIASGIASLETHSVSLRPSAPSAPLRLIFALLLPLLAHARDFDLRRDTFVFANETAWQYGVDERGTLHISARETPPTYAHRCFVMSRAVLQFWQFARFDPRQPRVSREEYARLIRRISRVPVWSARNERIVVPGFRDLREFSTAMPVLLQEHLGAWLPTYLRPGNYRMAMGHPRCGQAAAARWLEQSLAEGKLRAIYIARFPHLNHCLIAYRCERLPAKRRGAEDPEERRDHKQSSAPLRALRASALNEDATTAGDVRFWLYDPNYPGQPAWIDYRAAERSFDFQPRWYFPGGRVNVMRTYISPFH